VNVGEAFWKVVERGTARRLSSEVVEVGVVIGVRKSYRGVTWFEF
jgi:hypothetical protein